MPRIPLNVAATLPRKLGHAPKPLPENFEPTAADARSLYRQLWRTGSLSIMYSSPGTRVIRQKIREAFEESKQHPETDPTIIRRQWDRAFNTLFFFEIASTRYGIEHSIISNLTRITAEERLIFNRSQKSNIRLTQKEVAIEFNETIQALNDSMGLSLR